MSVKTNRRGVTRVVFMFRRFVIKIPNPSYSWIHFLKGLIANINEGQVWRYNKDNPEKLSLICPVIWTSWGGWLLIMKRADVEKWCDEIRSMPCEIPEENIDWHYIDQLNKRTYKKWIDAGLGGDDKADNYGYYQDRLVKVDYGQ